MRLQDWYCLKKSHFLVIYLLLPWVEAGHRSGSRPAKGVHGNGPKAALSLKIRGYGRGMQGILGRKTLFFETISYRASHFPVADLTFNAPIFTGNRGMQASRNNKLIILVLVMCGISLFSVVLFFVFRESKLLREAIRDSTPTPEKVVADGLEFTKETASEITEFSLEKSKEVFSEIKDLLKNQPNGGSNQQREKRKGQSETSTNESAFEQGLKFGYSIAQSLDDSLQGFIELSKSEQRELGEKIHREITNNGAQIYRNQRLSDLLSELAAPFLESRTDDSIEYQFFVLNDSEVNAFATVGGYVYLNRGLIEFMSDPAELQFVIGHEIAHNELGHCAKNVSVMARAEELVGSNLAQLAVAAYQAISLGYSEAQELAADRYSCERMSLDKYGAISAIQRLDQLNESQTVELEGGHSTISKAIEGHFASHPSGTIRAKKLQSVINEE